MIKPLTHIETLSIFPDLIKTAKVVNIYNSNKKSNFNHFRSISLLSLSIQLSEVVEKCVKCQLQNYLESKHILESRIIFIYLAKAFDLMD